MEEAPYDHGAWLFTINPQTYGITSYERTYHLPFWKQHAALLWVAWGPLAFLQIVSGRYGRVYWKVQMWIHIITGLIIMILSLVYSFLAL